MLGLANLSPVQWLAAGAVLGAGAVSTPALAQTIIPGVGTVVKMKPGDAAIVAPTNSNGVVRLTGLEPGSYEVSLIGEARVTKVQVGRDGVLTTRAVADGRGSPFVQYPFVGGSRGQLSADNSSTDNSFNLPGLFGYEPIAVPRANPDRRAVDPLPPRARFIDVNASTAAEITRLAPTTTPEAATFIVGERTRGGPFKGVIDFVQRVCPNVSVDFNLTPTRIGPVQIIARGNDPIKSGFKCAPATRGAEPSLELYGVRQVQFGQKLNF